ncbi:hypothetical protein QE152_g11392 [Popillia japonica]|uniref:Uncharacterized protein n=1 Tax=Popillia japonica TaxID=7064 RepID=A0AAW1LRQ3_POPJA
MVDGRKSFSKTLPTASISPETREGKRSTKKRQLCVVGKRNVGDDASGMRKRTVRTPQETSAQKQTTRNGIARKFLLSTGYMGETRKVPAPACIFKR